MRIRLAKMGDPWMDLGLVAFYRELEHIRFDRPKLVGDLILTPGFVEIEVDEDETEALVAELCKRMVQKLNRILLPPVEWKLLDDSEWKSRTDEHGFYDEAFKKTLTPEEIAQLKAGKTVHGKEFRPIKQPQKHAEMTSMRNFIGLKADWRRLKESHRDEIRDFFSQWQGESKGSKKGCPLCGREAVTKTFRPMNQSRNVLFNQHHAVAVRGYATNVTKESMCPTCNLLNLYATVQVDWHPYFVSHEDVTHLMVPVVSDLQSLSLMMKILSSKLLELHDSGNVTHYRTNIDKLWHRTLYPAILTVYYWLGKREEELEDLHWEPREWTSVSGWLIPRYSRGQVVIFKEFTRVRTDESLFRLTRPVSFGKDGELGDVVNDFLLQLRCFDPWLIDRIARGLVEKNLRWVATGLFHLFKMMNRDDKKNGLNARGCLFFRDYLTHFIGSLEQEVVSVLNEQLQGSLRALGQLIGSTHDVSVLTRIHAAPTCEAFVKALKDALFKVYKDADRQRKDGLESEELHAIGTKRMQEILVDLNEKNLGVIRDTLSIYANLAAIQAHQRKKQAKERVEA